MIDPTVAAYAIKVLSMLPGLVTDVAKLLAFIKSSAAQMKIFTLEKRDPTPEEWADLDKLYDALGVELHAR